MTILKSTPLAGSFCLRKNPSIVAMNTISIEIKSPPNNSQNDALASPTSTSTSQGLRRFFSRISRNLAVALQTSKSSSTTFQLRLLRSETVLKLILSAGIFPVTV